ncbi:glycerate kinase [Marinilactibacillus sp. Marseille-P9653]|uniref:glycerate kinase n=1 Tax=Marinilactibacillus sp. Marseille-P9653 TaxID=2866583 RepID=UPI001CE3CB6C|nr:glycerate kinase [Marinilactibacillus sp. Marseille-P9653]
MTNILIASDSFKGSADSKKVAEQIAKGIKRVSTDVSISEFAIADGGEGTVEAIVRMTGGSYHYAVVRDPYGKKVNARFGMIDKETAIIEIAEASGLQYLESDSDSGISSTYGTGELIRAALDIGAKHIYIGLGGSATIDGGAGMAQALGIKLLDRAGVDIGYGVRELERLDRVDFSQIDTRIANVNLNVLSDVMTNPLTGQNGAIAVFGPQKGVQKSDIKRFDELLKRYADIIEKETSHHYQNAPGSGAAGGLGFALQVFCRAELTSGIEEVLKLIKIEEALKKADLVITGEGNMDGQSVQGKAPVGVARLAKKYGLPVIAIVGGREKDLSKIYHSGIDLVIDTVNRPMTLQEAISDVEALLIEAGETAFRAYQLGAKK